MSLTPRSASSPISLSGAGCSSRGIGDPASPFAPHSSTPCRHPDGHSPAFPIDSHPSTGDPFEFKGISISINDSGRSRGGGGGDGNSSGQTPSYNSPQIHSDVERLISPQAALTPDVSKHIPSPIPPGWRRTVAGWGLGWGGDRAKQHAGRRKGAALPRWNSISAGESGHRKRRLSPLRICLLILAVLTLGIISATWKSALHSPTALSRSRSGISHGSTVLPGNQQGLLATLFQDYARSGGLFDGRGPAIVLRYETCGGLFNQHYCQLAGLTMAAALGAQAVVMPPALARNKFQEDPRETVFSEAGAASIWDVAGLSSYLAGRGIAVQVLPTIFKHKAADGLGGFNPYGLNPEQVVKFPFIWRELLTEEQLRAYARQVITQHVTGMMESQAHQQQKSLPLAEPLDSKLAQAKAVVLKSQSKHGIDPEPSSLPVSSLRSDSDSASEHATSASTSTRGVDDKPGVSKAGQNGVENKRRTSNLLGVQAGLEFAAGKAKGAGKEGGITVGGEGGADVWGDYDGPDAEIDSGEDAIAALDAIGRADDIFLGNTKAMGNAAGGFPPSKIREDPVQGRKGVGQHLDLDSSDGSDGNSSGGSSGSEVDLWTKTDMWDPPLMLQLHVPCILFGVQLRDSELASEIAGHLDFSPAVYTLANKIIDGMAEAAGKGGEEGSNSTFFFNGLHLRLEADASAWIATAGGHQPFWDRYLAACLEEGFGPDTPLYVASGIFSAMTPLVEDNLGTVRRELASHVFHKGQFLTPAELNGLHSEQRALVDFLVLARAQHFVGFEESTFSLFLREWRYLHHLPRASSALVAAAVADIGGQSILTQGGTFTLSGDEPLPMPEASDD